jgi:hypothetical protein
MFFAKRIVTASVLSLLLSGAAQAALTAEQVWAGWQANAVLVGLEVSAANTKKEGSVLTLSNVTLRGLQLGFDNIGSIAQITMTEKADGSVTITQSPELSLAINTEIGKGKVTVNHDGFSLTARENNGTTSYDFSGKTLTIAGDFDGTAEALDGSGSKPSSLNFIQTVINLRGSYSDTPGANRTFRFNLVSDGTEFTLDQVSPALDQTTKQSGTSDAMDLAAEFSLPTAFDMTAFTDETRAAIALEAALRDGFAGKVTVIQGASTQKISDSNPLFSYAADVTSAPSTIAFQIDRNGMDVGASAAGFTAMVTSPEMPFPALNLKAGNMAMAFRMPLTGRQMQDFRYMIDITDLVVGEEAWALVDPTKAFPRDPASLSLDMTGKAVLDIMGMMQAEQEGRTPDEPQIGALNIVDLNVSAVGAALSGSGAFTFDNSTGIPVPSGASDIRVEGANGLIDKLIAAGFLPQQDATGARMALALFMEPGEGEDVLTSKIEARADGSIYVNGQKMQ